MFRLVFLHGSYVLNKKSIIVFLLLLLFYLLICSYIVRPNYNLNDELLYQDMLNENYERYILLASELILILFSTFIFSYSKQNSYYMLVNKSKLSFYTTRALCYLSVVVLLGLALYIIYLLTGYFFTNWFYFSFESFISFQRIIINSVIMGLFTQVIIYLFKSNLCFILSFLAYITLKNLLEDTTVGNVVSVVIPILNDNKYVNFRDLFQSIFYLLLGFLLFIKDENY